jgi:peptide-methionine (S)-S-oxide reductase
MLPSTVRGFAALGTGLVAAVLFGARAISGSAASTVTLPDPTIDQPVATAKGEQTIVLGGGCFWGVQAVFQRVKGVVSATSGYAGGTVSSPNYMQVTTGTTGHAEVVKVVFDSSQVSLGQILKVFFSVVHDPTQLNRQGPDVGTQYRSAVYYTSDGQRKIVDGYVAQLKQAKAFREPIVTEVAPLKAFYEAEAYHQNYYDRHPNQPYIVIHDRPKVEALKTQFASLWKE